MDISGNVATIIFRNQDNGYTVGKLETNDDLIPFTGNFSSVDLGDYLTLSGHYFTHPTYGEQFRVESYKYSKPTSEQATYNYLASGVLPGIGEKTAELIVERFGTGVFDILDTHPEALLEIRGIGKRTLERIVEAYRAHTETRDAMLELEEYGIPPKVTTKLFKTYGDQTVSKILEDPYRVIKEVPGYGFRRADQLAEKMGMEKSDQRRVQAGLEYVLNSCFVTGSTYLEEDEFIQKSAQTLEISPEQAKEEIEGAYLTGNIHVEELEDGVRAYYPEALYQDEESAALSVSRLMGTKIDWGVKNLDKMIEGVEADMGIQLDPSQKEAVASAVTHGLSIITGGPGTGKTTIINGILMISNALNMTTVLAAPTGRAAKRMTETTAQEALTIHRLLEYDPVSGYKRDEENPIEADAIIIDETSMVDISLFARLLDAVKDGTRIVFVGDADQLPSVGPGNVLNDLIKTELVNVVTLDQIHRQQEGSEISKNAREINRGVIPTIDNHSDFMFVRKSDDQVALDTLLDVVSTRMPERFELDRLKDIQVLSPIKKGILGTENLNRELQQTLNPPMPYKEEIQVGDQIFREGDKVMQMKNNYQISWEDNSTFGEGVFNGDIGVITEICDGDVSVHFSDDKVATFTEDTVSQLSLAYCSTIHKAQGSEFPGVVLALAGGRMPFNNRRLLYTGVTRAKKKLFMIGKEDTFKHMVKNQTDTKRASLLAQRIKNYHEIGI